MAFALLALISKWGFAPNAVSRASSLLHAFLGHSGHLRTSPGLFATNQRLQANHTRVLRASGQFEKSFTRFARANPDPCLLRVVIRRPGPWARRRCALAHAYAGPIEPCSFDSPRRCAIGPGLRLLQTATNKLAWIVNDSSVQFLQMQFAGAVIQETHANSARFGPKTQIIQFYGRFAHFSCNISLMNENVVLPKPSALIEFRASNVRSFKDDIELSMLSTGMSIPDVVRMLDWRKGGRTVGVLPVAGIFGANASGKSNLLRVMADMRNLVLDSFRTSSQVKTTPIQPFLLDPEHSKKPSSFEVDLILSGIRHQYGFTILDSQILEEWAFAFPNGKQAKLFTREGLEIKFGSTINSGNKVVVSLLKPEALYLTTAATANIVSLKPLYQWFSVNLKPSHRTNVGMTNASTTQLLDDPTVHKKVVAMLRAADLGIDEVNKHNLSPSLEKRLSSAITTLLQQLEIPLPPEEELKTFDVKLSHQGTSGSVEIDEQDESQGTRVWFGLIGSVIQSLASGTIILGDDLDANLHPLLVRQLIEIYQNPKTNSNAAQLIFNSHDVSLLGETGNTLLGRDQVWFTEKLNGGASRLYPLSDLDPRKHEAIGRRYLAGRYGGVPILSSNEFEAALQPQLSQ